MDIVRLDLRWRGCEFDSIVSDLIQLPSFCLAKASYQMSRREFIIRLEVRESSWKAVGAIRIWGFIMKENI